MNKKEQPTQCVTCKSQLPPGTQIDYFAQGPLCPTQDDLGLSDDLVILLHYTKAVFDVLGCDDGDGFEEDTREELGKLGRDIAAETIRRFRLYSSAASRWYTRAHDGWHPQTDEGKGVTS